MVALMCKGNRPHAHHCVRSFKKHLPEHKFVHLTDLETPMLEGADEVIRFDWPQDMGMMLWLIRAYAEVPCDFTKDVLITTADDCILDMPFPIEGDYDVAIVKRKERGHGLPFTNGLVIVKHPKFYKDCYDDLLGIADHSSGGQKYRDWNGDMLCIQRVIERNGYKWFNLPEQFFRKPNFEGDGKDGKTILWHYAGEKKHWMHHHGSLNCG